MQYLVNKWWKRVKLLRRGRGVKINLTQSWMTATTLKLPYFNKNIFFKFNQKCSQIKVIILYISVVLSIDALEPGYMRNLAPGQGYLHLAPGELLSRVL